MSDRSVSQSNGELFSYGVAELAEAQSREPPARTPHQIPACAKPPVPRNSGFDPYNSTGGFQRKNAWNRIRKR